MGQLWPLFFFSLALANFDEEKPIEFWNKLARENLERKLEEFKEMHDGQAPKNIILFIGDGMGITSITAARIYKAERDTHPGQYEPFFMETFESTGWSKTASWSAHVTDSAAGAVSLLTGMKVNSDTLGVMPGEPSNCSKTSKIIGENVAELSIKKGLSVGVVSTVSVTHATPGAAYAKGIHRTVQGGGQADNNKIRGNPKTCLGEDIAAQVLMEPANRFSVIMGGGRHHFVNNSILPYGQRVDSRNIEAEWKKLPGKRQLVTTIEDLQSLKTDDPDLKVLGLFSARFIERKYVRRPLLAEMTEKTIRILANNQKGYFALIEGGLIDIYEHQNRIKLQAEELIEFNEAIQKAREMTNSNETLIIVTADHSHSLAIGEFDSKKSPIMAINNKTAKFGVAFSHGPGYANSFYGASDNFSPGIEKYKTRTYLHTKSGYHGGDHVPIYADGPYSWLFSSTIQNTEIGYLMKYLLCLKEDCVGKTSHQNSISAGQTESESESEKSSGEEIVLNVVLAFLALSVICLVASMIYLVYKVYK